MEQGAGKDGKSPTSAVATAQKITSLTCTGTESASDSSIVQDEYGALSRDHREQVEAVAERGSSSFSFYENHL